MSQMKSCLDAAHHFQLSREQALAIVEKQIETINENWPVVCDTAELNTVDRNMLWGRQFLNPYALVTE